MKDLLVGWLSWLPEALQAPTANFIVNLGLAALYLIIGIWLSGWLSRLLKHGLSQVKGWDQTLTPPFARLIYIAGMVITLFTILTTFGVKTTAILAVLSGAALAIGLAVQGTLSNVASGIMLLLLRPLRNGDYVSAGGAEGNVIEINLFRTSIRMLSGAVVSVPNSNVFGDNVINYSSPQHRGLWEPIGIAYDADIDMAKEIIFDVLSADHRWFIHPDPAIYVTKLGDFAVELTVSAKCNTADYFSARSDFLERVKKQFDAKGVGIPFPTRTVYLKPDAQV